MAYPSGSHADAEVIVVGGGPAGSTVAALLATVGHDVVVLDKARFPRHKACSEYINPEAVRLLDLLGVGELVRATGPHLMKRMVVHAPGGKRFAADFEQVESGRLAIGLSRFRFDALLLEFAKSRGVRVIEGCHVRDVLREGGRVAGVTAKVEGHQEEIRGRIVIGADGRHSVVARSLGLSRDMPWFRRTGLMAHYRDLDFGGLDDQGELHVGRGSYAGIAPLEDGLFNVAFVSPSKAVIERKGTIDDFFTDELATIPGVADRLAYATRIGPVRGVGPMAHRLRRTAGDGYLLVGDAAGFLDPFTGEGIYEALKSAYLAAPIVHEALQGNDTSAEVLESYRRARRRTFAAKRQVGWIVQGFIGKPVLMDYVTERLGRRQAVARTLTGVLGDFRPATAALSPVFLARLLRP